ncbi:winged helix-turn-helix transcriptional regulator [Kineococcus sp. SYSU DK018]|uniref:winged helix-turn-helix transcriptional regulator n=1 Tax=Kineococcus sp. SYSU DK018 TaxID=3383139 RepID=UPI003D7C4BF0
MKRTSSADWQCSVARTTDLIGDWWTPLVLRDASRGTTRFDDFQASLGISRNVLSQRLERLVGEGMLLPRPYSLRPPRQEYLLTEKGRDFFGVILAMMAWGDRWLADGEPPFPLRHTTCGHVTTPQVTCTQCGGRLDLATVEPAGPADPDRERRPGARAAP